MTKPVQCVKCSGAMKLGSLKTKGHYGNSPYEWSPHDDAAFPLAGAPSQRRDVQMYRCTGCGYLELYA
jgi:hypothetical protein